MLAFAFTLSANVSQPSHDKACTAQAAKRKQQFWT